MTETIKRAQAGDQSAMAMVLRDQQPSLLGFLTQFLGNRDNALDATQETLVKISKHLPNYKEHGNFKAWVFRIARNVALDHIRQQQRKGGDILELSEEVVALDARPQTATVIQREECVLAMQLVQQLPATEREVMTLRVIQNMKFKDIAEITNAPLNTVLGRMRNASRKLKQWMEERA